MRIYLVGGAVRDQLLNRPISECDWVVVGATEQEMLELGYQKVGRNFPVFLHPITHEEYALARTERKTGKGYTQFACYADPQVTLEEDLRRRDLTINAIAQTPDGKLIDPYGGITDLKNKILRHVSEAFAEDPVRILRVARFAAKLSDFKVHPTTLVLMRKIIAAGELNALIPERVWQELIRALAEPNPEKFFIILDECGALQHLFSEIAGTLANLVPKLKQAALYTNILPVRFAVLMGQIEISAINSFCHRYRVPRAYSNLAKVTAKHLNAYRHILHADANALLTLLEALDAFRQPQKLHLFTLACTILISDEALANQTVPQLHHQLENHDSPHSIFLMNAYNVAKQIDIKKIIATESHKEKLKARIRESRLAALSNLTM